MNLDLLVESGIGTELERNWTVALAFGLKPALRSDYISYATLPAHMPCPHLVSILAFNQITDITLCHHITHMHNLCLMTSLLIRADSAQLLSLYAALGQACVNWPIRGELVFRRRCLKETKKECFRQRENTLSIKASKPVLIVTQVKILRRMSMINSFCTEICRNVYSTCWSCSLQQLRWRRVSVWSWIWTRFVFWDCESCSS